MFVLGLAVLRAEASALSAQYYAANSRVTRSMQIRCYFKFIDYFGGLLSPTPCPSDQVALYVAWLTRSLKYSSICNYLSALNFFLKAEGAEPINYSSYQVKTVLGGAKRVLGCAVKQSAPLLPANLLLMFSFMAPTIGHTCIRAALLTGFRGLLRKCQLTASDSVLLRSNFVFYDWGMVVYIRRSKTIQFAERELLIPISRVRGRELCAVYWTRRHFDEVRLAADQPAFQVPADGTGFRPLDYATLQSTIKYLAACAGLDSSMFSCHSLRRGGATYLAMQGASITEIKARGDWASETVYKYIVTPLSERILCDMRVASTLEQFH